MNEFEEKQSRIRALLNQRNLDALLLRRVSSFAWATCGAASYVNTAASEGVAALLITPTARYLITNNIEAPRLALEEHLDAQGWDFQVTPWHAREDRIAALTRGLRVGADAAHPNALDLGADMASLRANLTSTEGERFRMLGRVCADAMETALRAVRPGMSEYEIAAQLAYETERRGAQAIVNLIATDELISGFRHPLPTAKKLERYAMLVLCGRKWGLVCSITRLVHFGQIGDDLRRRASACAQVDAVMIGATRPDKTLGEIFRRATEAYRDAGFADEWQLHHQGGSAGYEAREVIATPDSTFTVTAGQAFAWNPSITGCKSEDTILVGENGNEILTATRGLPTVSVNAEGRTFERPGILELE